MATSVKDDGAAEIIERPDLDAVLADERNRELIEEYESEAKTRPPPLM